MINVQTLKERETQLLARFNELREVFLNGDDSVLTEYQTISDELKGVKKAIYQIEHAEQEKQADAEKQKANQLAAEKEMAKEKERQAREAEKVRADEEAQKAENEAKQKWDALRTRLSNNLKNTAEKIISALKQVQFTPSTICVEPNNGFMKKLFNLDEATFRQALHGKTFNAKEKNKTKKKDAVFSRAIIQNATGYDDATPLDEFDRAVLGVVISEYLFGNKILTTNTIFRALIGKIGQANFGIYPDKNQESAIVNSLLKLMSKFVNLQDVTQNLNDLKYVDKDGNEFSFKWTRLLPAGIAYAKINGQESTVIFFNEISPLYEIADAKSQVIRYPHELLNVPGQRNTPLIIAMKKYVMRRICEIKLHKQLTPTITFDDVFQKCRVENTTDRKEVMRRREYILKFFEHLKEQNFIKNYEVVKKGTTIHGVKFSY